MIKKLQIKFVVINMTIVTIMLMIIFGLVYTITSRNLEQENINMMKTIAANPFHTGLPNDSSEALKLPFFTLRLSLNGELVSADGGYYDLSDRLFLNSLVAESIQSPHTIGTIENHNLRYCRFSMPMGTILVFSDISSEKTTLHHLLQTFAVIGILSFLAFLAISILLSKWAIKPVAKAWNQQKQFIADASHELKTPLTVIMTNVELLKLPQISHKEQETFLQNIHLMSTQMKHLIEELLTLAKSDYQKNAFLNKKLFNLSDLVVDTCISFEGPFIERGFTLKRLVELDIMICGNQEAIRQVLGILLDNARKYSAEGSTPFMELYSKNCKKCCVKISSHGTEISKEDLKKIFQRFYRLDKSRNRSVEYESGSFGLGLSIAESIIHMHKGKIWAESQNGINSFYVELRKN